MYNQENYSKLLILVGIAIFCFLFIGRDLVQISFIDLFRNASTASLITIAFHFSFKNGYGNGN